MLKPPVSTLSHCRANETQAERNAAMLCIHISSAINSLFSVCLMKVLLAIPAPRRAHARSPVTYVIDHLGGVARRNVLDSRY